MIILPIFTHRSSYAPPMWFVIIYLILALSVLGMVIDGTTGSHIARRIFFKSAPEYILPKEYSLKYNPDIKKYAIAVGEDGYMEWEPILGFKFYYSKDDCATFTDSSFAKGMLKSYIEKSNFK